MTITLYNESCFSAFKRMAAGSVDMVCVDPPYGTTTINWDRTLDTAQMWAELQRIVKPQGMIVMFGSQPFTALLIVSKIDWFRHELIWNKNKCGSPGLARYRPQKVHENIMVFARESGGTYNPIMEAGEAWTRTAPDPARGYGSGQNTHGYGFGKRAMVSSENTGTRYPKSILHASRNFSAQQTVHPTQKPTNLLNWLIMTYSNPGDTVLDFTMGSGSCGVAAKLCGRHFIGVEQDSGYFQIAEQRIAAVTENTVTPQDQQLSTQLPEEVKTVPDQRYEAGVLETIRGNPSRTKTQKQDKSQGNPLSDDLFEF